LKKVSGRCVIGFPLIYVGNNASYKMHIFIDRHRCIVYNAYMLFEIGIQIRQARRGRKITQAVLAKAIGMSRTTIGQIENGTVQDVGVRKLIRVLEFLKLELRVRSAGSPPTLEELREEEAIR
jgi:DNA-binding XRE family transcriptional regulator